MQVPHKQFFFASLTVMFLLAGSWLHHPAKAADVTSQQPCPQISIYPQPTVIPVVGTPYSSRPLIVTPAGSYSFAVTSGALPPGLLLNVTTGSLSGTPAQGGTYNFRVTATAGNCSGFRDLSLIVVCGSVGTLSPLPNATAGAPYTQTITISSPGNYSFAVTQGMLPNGLMLSTSTGVVSGVPLTGNTNYSFTVTATAGSCRVSRTYWLMVSCPTITLSDLPTPTAWRPYSQRITASPASANYSFTVVAGALPAGLSLNQATGVISGTVMTFGGYNFTIRATGMGGWCSATRTYTGMFDTVCSSVIWLNVPNGVIGQAYNAQVGGSAIDYQYGYQWPPVTSGFGVTRGPLPPGLTLDGRSGRLAGVPSQPGSYSFTITFADSTGCRVSHDFTVAITGEVLCPAIAMLDLPTPTFNTPYHQPVAILPTGHTYTFALVPGSGLPAGLSLAPTTGIISGVPTAAGPYTFTIAAVCGGYVRANKFYSGTIMPPCPEITWSNLPTGVVGQPYDFPIGSAIVGGNWNLTSGSLPPGQFLVSEFNGPSARLFGSPTQAGTYNFTVTFSGPNGCTDSHAYALVVKAPSLPSAVNNDFDGDGKSDLTIRRAEQRDWVILRSSDEQPQEALDAEYDADRDTFVPGDYDGDGKFDVAVFRSGVGSGRAGEWLIKDSKEGLLMKIEWGLAGDTPVPADYDGDGRTDIAVWRGAEGAWYIRRSSDGQTQPIFWGAANAPHQDLPVPADYDGDGKADVAVYRQSTGHWYIKLSSDGSVRDKFWGSGTDVPVVADFDGDGKADIAVWRRSETNWYVLQSSDGAVQVVSWGSSSLGDVPVPGDYDGDGKTDVAVWRPTDGRWYVKLSGNSSTIRKAFGQSGDQPVTTRQR